jgi:hypothetical protein
MALPGSRRRRFGAHPFRWAPRPGPPAPSSRPAAPSKAGLPSSCLHTRPCGCARSCSAVLGMLRCRATAAFAGQAKAPGWADRCEGSRDLIRRRTDKARRQAPAPGLVPDRGGHADSPRSGTLPGAAPPRRAAADRSRPARLGARSARGRARPGRDLRLSDARSRGGPGVSLYTGDIEDARPP